MIISLIRFNLQVGVKMYPKYELTVIIPTFNEEINIARIIEAVNSTFSLNKIRGEILIVDDESRDKTIKIVKELMLKYNNLRIIVRHTDHGLSQSVVEGFRQANSNTFLVIDADFSHPPALIPRFYEEIKKGTDIVIGSRYTHGGGIKQWPLKRRILSLGATGLGRILFPEVTDPVSGFFAQKRKLSLELNFILAGTKFLWKFSERESGTHLSRFHLHSVIGRTEKVNSHFAS